jgi:malate/lactate dehydrogenase
MTRCAQIHLGRVSKLIEHLKHVIAALRRIIESIVGGMKPFGPRTVLLLVSNPVDVLTAVAQRASGLPTERVIGSGAPLQPQ